MTIHNEFAREDMAAAQMDVHAALDDDHNDALPLFVVDDSPGLGVMIYVLLSVVLFVVLAGAALWLWAV